MRCKVQLRVYQGSPDLKSCSGGIQEVPCRMWVQNSCSYDGFEIRLGGCLFFLCPSTMRRKVPTCFGLCQNGHLIVKGYIRSSKAGILCGLKESARLYLRSFIMPDQRVNNRLYFLKVSEERKGNRQGCEHIENMREYKHFSEGYATSSGGRE